MKKCVFISADHGLAVIYFLQSEVIPTLLAAGVEVVVLSDEALQGEIAQRFGWDGMVVEGLRFKQLGEYASRVSPEIQWWAEFFRRVGSSHRINTEAVDSYVRQVAVEEGWKRRALMPLARLVIGGLRRWQPARGYMVGLQERFNPKVYVDLFDRYQPSLVVTSTFGWRLDRYLLREAAARGVKTATAVVGWDNPSSYGLPAARMDYITCWSEIQRQELTFGSDWRTEQVNVGGIPSYDGYFRRAWLIPREQYFRLHGLDPERKLVSYAASFVSFSPNYQNVEALAHLIVGDSLVKPSQLLVRLHPNHFQNNPLYAGEREKIYQLARQIPHVHVVEPVPLGGSLGYYSGEDMPEKSSMMAYSDVFTTVYSTMVVEAAIHDRPIVSVCLDTPGGWNWPRKYSLALSRIGNWPTHMRFRQAGAGQVALDEDQLRQALNLYLENPDLDREQRRAFIANECTYTDGSAGRRTGEFLLSILS